MIIYLANPTMCSLRKRAGTDERREGHLATHQQCDLGCVPDFSGLQVLFFFYTYLFFFFLFPAVLGLHCCACFSLVAATKGCSLVAEHRLLIMGAALVAEHRLSGTG